MRERTADTVRTYFQRANIPEIRRYLPQKAKTIEEALEDFEKTQLPRAASYGRTVWTDDAYIGDIWCYCINKEEQPNAMLSFCIFDIVSRGKGIASKAVGLFICEIRARYGFGSIGAFTYKDNKRSLAVLLKNGFSAEEEFTEEGRESVFLQKMI